MSDAHRQLGGSNDFFIGLAVFLLALHLLQPAPWAMVYDRAAVADGEFWRLLSGALVHLTGEHLALNLVGLALIWGLFGFRMGSGSWLFVAAFSAVMGSAAGYWLDPEVLYSVGASGLLHGLLAAGCLAEVGVGGRLGYAILAILIAKIATEQFAGGVSAQWLANPINVQAHWHGAAAGGGAFALLVLYRCLRRRR